MNRNLLYIIAALIFFGGVLYYASQASNQPTVPTNQDSRPVGGSPGDVTNDNVKTFEVTGRPFEFNPKEIRVNRGDTVRIVFRNVEGLHDWSIDEFNARTEQITAGQTETIEFVADRAGNFEYYCSVNNHRQMGMVGTLTVEE